MNKVEEASRAEIIPPEKRPADPDKAAALARVESLARLLDTQFRLPGLGYRFGLDFLIGLIPGIGDAATGAISFYILLEAVRLGAGPWTILRMVYNIAIDMLFGAVPLLGDLFDFAFRSNRQNAELLRRFLMKDERA